MFVFCKTNWTDTYYILWPQRPAKNEVMWAGTIISGYNEGGYEKVNCCVCSPCAIYVDKGISEYQSKGGYLNLITLRIKA